MSALASLTERIHRQGTIGFDEYVEICLDEFYGAHGGRAGGGGGDFITSPELGPLFGAVVARALDTWWDELSRPDPFFVVEAGAGAGTLARAVLDAAPRCLTALRYLLVERSAALRERQPSVVPLEPPALVLGPLDHSIDEDEDEGVRPLPGRGPLLAALEELPVGPLTGVVLANELLDNLPFGLLERRDGSWFEVRVGEGIEEVLTAAHNPPPIEVPDGGRVPVQEAAADWLRRAARLLDRGRVVVIDYAATTAELADRPWTEWVRTYRSHGRGGHPLEHPGEQDVTCEVCVDQLKPAPTQQRTQAEFLRAHGLDELVDEARRHWEATAAAPTLESMKAKSRISEAAALTDEAGLGAFKVLEWIL